MEVECGNVKKRLSHNVIMDKDKNPNNTETVISFEMVSHASNSHSHTVIVNYVPSIDIYTSGPDTMADSMKTVDAA